MLEQSNNETEPVGARRSWSAAKRIGMPWLFAMVFMVTLIFTQAISTVAAADNETLSGEDCVEADISDNHDDTTMIEDYNSSRLWFGMLIFSLIMTLILTWIVIRRSKMEAGE